MGLGVQSGWSDPTNPSWVPGGSDFLKLFNDVKRLAVRPAGKWTRYDTSLVGDNNWYDCRVAGIRYDVDAEGGQIVGPITGSASTFNVTTTGIWGLGVRERYSGSLNGDHSLGIMVVGAVAPLVEHTQTIVPAHVQTNWCYTEEYLTAGQQVKFQHKYQQFSGGSDTLTLYTTPPIPEIIMRLVQERDLHA
jgi:hypothetical protein